MGMDPLADRGDFKPPTTAQIAGSASIDTGPLEADPPVEAKGKRAKNPTYAVFLLEGNGSPSYSYKLLKRGVAAPTRQAAIAAATDAEGVFLVVLDDQIKEISRNRIERTVQEDLFK